MGCFGECWDLGPPPDSILFIPPPPAPAPLQLALPDLFNATPCLGASQQVCELWAGQRASPFPTGGDYVELPRKDLEATTWTVPAIDDTTWIFILIVSSIGVLLFGALLAMFLLKCREMSILSGNECSMVHGSNSRQAKSVEPRECAALNNLSHNKGSHPSEAVLYAGPPSHFHDNRMVWAALTPRGTQHFVSENYPRNLIDYEPEDHYEAIDHAPVSQSDYDYEDPAPLLEAYQLNNMERGGQEPFYASLDNPDMRCASLGGYRRAAPPPPRPRVSPPTRIEHPNLPPLNLYPHKGASMTLTLKRNTTGGLRGMENGYRPHDTLLPKYNC